MTTRLYRIILFGSSIGVLKQFYVQCFGFTVKEEVPDQWVVLQAGAVELALHRIGEAYESSQPFVAESNTKLVFSVSDMQELRSKLIAAGADMGEVRSFEGYSSLFCDGRDPEGNVIQLEQPLG